MNMHVGSELALELHRQAVERRKRMAMGAKPKVATVVAAPVIIIPQPARVRLAQTRYLSPIGPLQPETQDRERPWIIYPNADSRLYARVRHYAKRQRPPHPSDADRSTYRWPIGPIKPKYVAGVVIGVRRDVLEIRTRAVTAITPKQIIKEVCDKHGVEHADLISARRTAVLTLPRFEAVYRMKTETLLSYPQMGRLMHRDHTSCIHAYRQFCKLIASGKVERPSPSIAAE